MKKASGINDITWGSACVDMGFRYSVWHHFSEPRNQVDDGDP